MSSIEELEKRLLKKLEDKEAAAKDPTKVVDTHVPKPLEVHTKINVTGKPQSLEEYMKAMGLPVKKKS